jgi:hypothetical protein
MQKIFAAEKAASIITQTLPTFVFQPGGVTANNVFATEPALVTALAKVQGKRFVECDFHLVGNVGTIGTVPWTGLGPTSDILIGGDGFLDPNTSLRTQLTVANGANFGNSTGGTILAGFEDLTVFGPTAGAEPIVLDNSTIQFRNCQFIGGATALIQSTGANGGTIELWDTTSIVSGRFYNGKNTSFTTIFTGNDAAVFANTLFSDVGAFVDYIPVPGSGGVSITQPGITGTFLIGVVGCPTNSVDPPTSGLLDIGPTFATGVRVGHGPVGIRVIGSSSSVADGSPVEVSSGVRASGPTQQTFSDGAAHAIYTLDCGPMTSGLVDLIMTIEGIDDGGGGAGALGDAAVWDIRWQGTRAGGALANLNGAAVITPVNSNAGAAGWGGPSVALVGNTFVVSVTGQNTHRIRWTPLRQAQCNVVAGTPPVSV